MRRSWTVLVVVVAAGFFLSGCLTTGEYPISATLQNGHAAVGLWHSDGGIQCLWERIKPLGTTGNISDSGPQYVEIKRDDSSFRTTGCQPWVQAGQAFDHLHPISSAGQFADGQYRVGPEVPSGTYLATRPDDCTWRRLSSFDGESASIIDEGFRSGVVTIWSGDVGFSSRHCGVWTKVS